MPDSQSRNGGAEPPIGGSSEIGLNNVLFYTDDPDDDPHIELEDPIVNGVACGDVPAASPRSDTSAP